MIDKNVLFQRRAKMLHKHRNVYGKGMKETRRKTVQAYYRRAGFSYGI